MQDYAHLHNLYWKRRLGKLRDDAKVVISDGANGTDLIDIKVSPHNPQANLGIWSYSDWLLVGHLRDVAGWVRVLVEDHVRRNGMLRDENW